MGIQPGSKKYPPYILYTIHIRENLHRRILNNGDETGSLNHLGHGKTPWPPSTRQVIGQRNIVLYNGLFSAKKVQYIKATKMLYYGGSRHSPGELQKQSALPLDHQLERTCPFACPCTDVGDVCCK